MGAWGESQKDWYFDNKPQRMSPEEFYLLREVASSIHFLGQPYTRYKARIEIGGKKRWCVVSRQFSFGMQQCVASRIIIQLKGVPA